MNSTVQSKKLLIEEITPSMVLAEDAYDENGQVILPKDTMINSSNYNVLKSKRINHVYIKLVSIDDLVRPFSESEQAKEKRERVIEKVDFKNFNRAYKESTVEIKNTLNEIGNGKAINLKQLYKLTSNVIDKMKFKSDIFTYISFLETWDESTYTHSNNVALLCNIFGRWLGFSNEELINITTAGILHDIGKTKVDQKVLNKQGKLSKEEFDEIKRHAVLGYRVIEKQNVPLDIKLAALMHHEKIDGSGYPIGAKAAQINKYAKIVAICDIYDAMTTDRIYRKKILPFDVIHTFERSCYGQLDTKYLLIFLQNIAYNYIGSSIELSNGDEGEIVFINRNNLSRPMIRTKKEIIDLSTRQDLIITNLY